MPKEILNAEYDKIDVDIKRGQAIREASRFLEQAKTELPAKGLYLTGPFGVGKTHFLGAIANKLKEINISSMRIYMPEFVREIKSSIQDTSFNAIIYYFKNAHFHLV